MTPDLHVIVRKKLEEQQVSPEGINAHLKTLPNLERYQNAFNVLFAQCLHCNVNLLTSSFWEIATQINRLNMVSSNQARHAYSALLLIPGMDQLRFYPLLKTCKNLWNQHSLKYPVFWSRTEILQKNCCRTIGLEIHFPS